MKKKHKEPPVPVERHETVRQGIISILEGQTLSAKEISGSVSIPEKEVYEHLEHIRMTVDARDGHLVITPAECAKCGFIFRKRERLKKPGKCPICRGESIHEPLFLIKKTTMR
ncbi:MAG TPA: transcriptional regulator [Nitrospiraceae bacterium]|nr:transcriptional regulator [Nitrospiraceae bacterium]